MDCSLPGSSVHGVFQARVLEWGAIAFSGGWQGRISVSQVKQHYWQQVVKAPLSLHDLIQSQIQGDVGSRGISLFAH